MRRRAPRSCLLLTALPCLLSHVVLHHRSDPSHLPFAHHKIISNRNQASYIDIHVDRITKEGFDSHKFYPRVSTDVTPPARPICRMTGRRGAWPHRLTYCCCASSSSCTVQKMSTSGQGSNSSVVAQSLHFRPPNLLFQVINFTDVSAPAFFLWLASPSSSLTFFCHASSSSCPHASGVQPVLLPAQEGAPDPHRHLRRAHGPGQGTGHLPILPGTRRIAFVSDPCPRSPLT